LQPFCSEGIANRAEGEVERIDKSSLKSCCKKPKVNYPDQRITKTKRKKAKTTKKQKIKKRKEETERNRQTKKKKK
jgi:hypothetical protein